MSSLPNPSIHSESTRTRFGLIALAGAGFFAIIVSVMVIAIAGIAVISLARAMGGSPPSRTQDAGVYAVPKYAGPYIAGVRLTGEIHDATADDVVSKLLGAQEDPQAVGILLEVSSPGGAVVPSQEIFDTVVAVSKTKPVVAYVREMAASGAYYASAGATQIIANRGSLLGSIGVIWSGFEADQLIQFLKIHPVTIKTGALKDAGSPTRPMNAADKAYLETLIAQTRQQFVADVQTARHTTAPSMAFLADGRVVLAPQALNLRLIDAIGSRQAALDSLQKLTSSRKKLPLHYYEDQEPFLESVTKRFSRAGAQAFGEAVRTGLVGPLTLHSRY